MSEWQEFTFGDVAALSNGTNFTKECFGRGLKILGVRDFGDRTHPDWSAMDEVKATALNSDRQLLAEGDLVFVRSNGNPALVGRSMLITAGPTATHSAFTIKARPNQGLVVPRFLAYQMRNAHRVGLMRAANGTNITNLSQPILASVPVLVPSRATQVKVLDVLGSIDDLIENNWRRVVVLEELARAIYREWFVKFRYPGHEEVPLVDSALGPIPEGWDVAPVSKAIAVNPRIKLDKSIDHPFMTMGDLDERGMGCRPSQVRQSGSGAKFERGDTLFARITPCLENGKTGLVQTLADGEVGLGSTEFIVLRGQGVGSAFTYCLAREADFRKHAVASMSGASGRQRVRNECFDTYLLAVPTRDVANAFEVKMKPLFAHVAVLTDEARALGRLRDLLLPKLVTGQIDVSTLDLDALVSTSSTGEAQGSPGEEQGSPGEEQGSPGEERGSPGEERGTTAGVGVA